MRLNAATVPELGGTEPICVSAVGNCSQETVGCCHSKKGEQEDICRTDMRCRTGQTRAGTSLESRNTAGPEISLKN